MIQKKAFFTIVFGVCALGFGLTAKETHTFLLPSPARSGIYIENIATGDVLLDIDGDKPFVPASIVKSITAAAALTTLGPDYRFGTDVVLRGDVRSGEVAGNLVIKVSGDPTLESSHFKEYSGFTDSIANALRTMGISRIKGDIILETDNFMDQDVPEGWMEEDLAWPYGAGHRSLNFRDNKFVLSMPSRSSVPKVPGLKIKYTPANGSLKVDRKRGDDTYILRGRVRKRAHEVALANPNPAATLKYELCQRLDNAGIKYGTAPVKASANETSVYTHFSPPLLEVLQSLMFRSDNMMAEGTLRALAPGKSREDAVSRELRMWEHRDIDTELIALEDGSGLSRNDRVTPYFMADILVWMASQYSATDYVSLFPKAGKDGTLKSFLRDSSLEGKVALKTGSMKGVQCYAGYVLGADGLPTHVVIIMINKFNCSRSKVKEEAERLLLDIFAVE